MNLHGWVLAATSLTAAASARPIAGDDAAATAIEKLKAFGALVQPVAQESDELIVTFSVQGAKVGDAELAPLADLKKVVELDLAGTKVTDAGLATVARLSELRQRLWDFDNEAAPLS